MGTSGGEPKTLLNALKPMLGPSGDIKSPQEVVRIVSLMRDAEKLMSRCVYINILKSTISMAKENKKSNETLEKFVSIGGWVVLNKWLSDGKKTDNFTIIIELLEILKDLPISVDTLKQGNTAKLVKYLTKVDNQEVKKMSASILKQWMALVRHKSGPEKPDKLLERSKQNDESMETGSQASDSSDVVLMTKELGSEPKLVKRLREVQQGESNAASPEKKVKTQEGKSKVKKDSKVIAIESAGFMNALVTAAVAVPVKKRKRVTTTAQKASTTPTTTTSSSGVSKPAFSGILEEIMSNQSQTHGLEEKDRPKGDENGSTNGKASVTDSQQNGSPPIGDAVDFTKESENTDKDKVADSNSSTPSTTTTEDVTEAEPPAKKPNKKGCFVTWAEDHKLASFHYFEMDEDERATIRHPINFINAAHKEMMHERELMEKAKRLNEDKMIEKVKWYRPRPIKGIAIPKEYGTKSEEKKIQKERESGVLADIFFSKSSLPDSPAEPDIEHEKKVTGEPKVIPHDEKGTTHLPPKQATPPATPAGVQLPAALASLFSGPPPTALAPSDPVSVQSLLDKIMSTGSSGQSNPLNQLLSSVKKQQQQQEGGAILPNALKNILEPLQSKTGAPRPTGSPGTGLLGVGPGDGPGVAGMNPMGPPGQFGPRGPRGPHFRQDQRPRFQGPGGPRPNMSFQGPDGPMGGQMPPRMSGPNRPRPLLPELSNRDDYQDEMYDNHESEGDDGNGLNMRGRGRGGPWGRGRGRGRGRGPAPICRHFVSQRGCLRGDSCHFLHPGINGPPL